MSRRALVLAALAALVVAACSPSPSAPGATTVELPAPPSAAPVAPDPVAAATKRLRAALASQAEGKRITDRVYPGVLGTRVVMAAIEGAYPGTGVMRVVLDEAGVSYGAHGDRPLGALAKLRGWFTALPDETQLLRLVNDAQFEGLMMIDMSQEHSAKIVEGVIELRFTRRAFPSGGSDPIS